jgi:hypothetical protein
MAVFCCKAGKIQYSSQGQSHLSELSKNPLVLMSVKFCKMKTCQSNLRGYAKNNIITWLVITVDC